MSYLVIWKDKLSKFRLTLKGGNNETIFTTEGYNQRATVQNAARIVKTLNILTRIDDRTQQ